MERGALLYEGKAKQVFATDDPGRIIIHFKDDATAFNGVKRASIESKGRINCAITTYFFERLASSGVPSHLVEKLSDDDLLCEKVQIIPVEVVIRNYIAGSLAKRYGFPEGGKLPEPLVELFYKSDKLDDPLMGPDVPVAFGWAKRWELMCMTEVALQVNRELTAFYDGLGIDLVDFKLEFGRTPDGRIVLADEITPDGSRLWEKGTRRKLDKDVFRRDLGSLSDTYKELYARIFGRDFA